ncbi:MAG: DNA topoisomerase IV subunit A [Bacteroidetes bacterium]|nr:MAG: DNA topoisomerase IV subunit A [Bacteroidota bacterium]
MPVVDVIPLHETAKTRYLNYALSVITSRALPDIRDGLKPVHRRILYAMHSTLHLYPDARFRKSAAVVGEVMGKFHPHGDTAIYDAMVRMAQDFSLRSPLVDGQGNFGSLDGDNAAAMRYTEARLRPLAMELLREIKKDTVHFRPNFDGSIFEPVVLPAKLPNLLLNGSTGIAVGMATNIPPHNITEVLDALLYMISSPNARVQTIVEKYITAPDFPTGGLILNTHESLVEIYSKGEGAIELRGEYESEGKSRIIITSIPYGLAKSNLIEQIADKIIQGKVPQLVDVRDESTDVVRIVLELKRGANGEAAMAYLLKHTSLQTRFHVNMTCLVPTDNPEIGRPEKVDLITILRHFLDFRLEVVTRRLRFELTQLEKRIHLLRGFEKIFDALDEAIRIIRASENKADAAQRLIHRFGLDDVQADAVLETKLYKLSRLEVDLIRSELAEKEKMAADIRALLLDETGLWRLIKKELRELRTTYADDRRTLISGPDEERTYSVEDYIIEEDAYIIVTRDGWVKRQRSYSEIDSIRVRDGDSVGWILPGSTRESIVFFTSIGKAYTTRIDNLSSTTGYGDPVQKLFDFEDGEHVVGVLSLDKRALPVAIGEVQEQTEIFSGDAEIVQGGPFAVAVSSEGYCLRVSVSNFAEPSTKNGRQVMRTSGSGSVIAVYPASGVENLCLATEKGFVLVFPVRQIPVVKSAAKGVIAMRLSAGDRVVGYALSASARQGLEVETSRGRREIVRPTKFPVSNRGNKGKSIISRGSVSKVIPIIIEKRLDNDSNGSK